MQDKTIYPHFAEIIANTTRHGFKLNAVVKVTDCYERYKTVRYFHAVDKSGIIWAVSDLDIIITDKSF